MTDPEPDIPPPAERRLPRSPLAVLTSLGFALLAGGFFVVWLRLDAVGGNIDPVRVAALESSVRSLQDRVAVLERRPVATPAPAPSAPAPPPDLRPLEARISALEQRPAATADTAPFETRLAAAELAARRATRLQAAAAALAAGLPLGAIPEAPPALARYAAVPPPTLATLRRDFDAAAAKAEAASRPDEAPGIAGQAWTMLSSLVTVRRGAEVVLGSPAATTLGKARERLDAGDIAGAIAALDGLDPPAAAAMADWRETATSLLAARAALAAS